jgi:hypothetical protein
MPTSFRKRSWRSIHSPTLNSCIWRRYSSGDPMPKMHETEATITTSRRARSDAVAAWRRRSISSLIDESFSM